MLSPIVCLPCCIIFFFFFNDTATTEIYTLSLHDALPILSRARPGSATPDGQRGGCGRGAMAGAAGIAMRGPLGFHRAAHGPPRGGCPPVLCARRDGRRARRCDSRWGLYRGGVADPPAGSNFPPGH